MNNMDFFTKKEIEYLKGEVTARDVALEAEKYAFEKQLLNGLGEEIKNTLKNPPKPSIWFKMKYKYLCWKQKRKDRKEYQKILKREKGGF